MFDEDLYDEGAVAVATLDCLEEACLSDAVGGMSAIDDVHDGD